MAKAEVGDWYALLTAQTGDIRRSREISAQLAALDEPEILSGVASRMISENAEFNWYIEPICDRLPAASLRQLAGEAAHTRGAGDNQAADAVVAYVSAHQPKSLTAYLRTLWDIRPNRRSYYASWPWRAADDAEVTGLLEVACDGTGPDAAFAVRCLLQTRRPEVLAQLPADSDHPAMTGFERNGDGELRRLHATAVWHLAFTPEILREWAARSPLRARQPSWPVSTGSGQQHLTCGFLDHTCPACQQRLHRLLRLDPAPVAIGIKSRSWADFAWCPQCGTFTDIAYARHPRRNTRAVDGPPQQRAWLRAGTRCGLVHPLDPIELIQLDERWRQQDWGLSNNRENLRRVGGEPTWILQIILPAPAAPRR